MEPYERKEETNNDGDLTESGKEVTDSSPAGNPLPADEDMPEDSPSESTEENGGALPEPVSPALEARDAMSLRERFSPELLWKKMTEAVHREQPSLAALMSGGFPDRIENSMLYVLFDAQSDQMTFHMVGKSKPLIVNMLRNLSGDAFADVTFLRKEGLREHAAPKRSLEDLKRDVNSNAMVRETADLFSGVIVDVLE